MFYEVNIERVNRDGRWDAPYLWEVTVFDEKGQDRQHWSLRGRGYVYSIQAAKKKALKHIMNVEKQNDKGIKFGVVVQYAGSAEQIKQQMDKVEYATE